LGAEATIDNGATMISRFDYIKDRDELDKILWSFYIEEPGFDPTDHFDHRVIKPHHSPPNRRTEE